jgi:hypothetical protein
MKEDRDRVSGTEAKQGKADEASAVASVSSLHESERENKDIFEKSVSNLSGFAVPLGSSRW